MSGQLDGRMAVVTGAGRGIGRATAVALAREGADVACVAPHRNWPRQPRWSARPAAGPSRSRPTSASPAHTLGLAAELAGTGVAVNILRPGPADTAMPAWILAQPPAQIGAGLHDRFVAMRDTGLLASPDQPARMITDLVTADTTGQIAGTGSPAPISDN